MADTVSMALAELVRKAEEHGDVDFLRDGVRVLSQALMEVEVSQHLGAERHERTAERSGQRRNQQCVIPPRRWSGQRARCVAAKTVGDEPFARRPRIPITFTARNRSNDLGRIWKARLHGDTIDPQG